MWYITHTSSGERYYFSNDKPKHTVGRVGTDLELQNDNCVSRSHAVFHMTESENETYLELEDMGSKYGTFINKDIEKNAPLQKGVKTRLKNNDIIRFGRLQNIWKIQQSSIITVTSALSADEVAQVNRNIKSIGGKILNHWSPCCSHLTMNAPSVTIKLLNALIDQSHVVTTKYWEDFAKAMAQRQSQLPKPELYRPAFDETEVDVRPKPQRRTIFNGLTFVFLCRKHFDMYGPIVRAAGGACKDLTSGVQKSFLTKNNVVVIQHIPSTQSQSSQTINDINEILEANSKRIIPEYEIGLAIINCSIKENCNPLYKVPESDSNTARLSSMDVNGGANTQSLNFAAPETNVNLVTSTPYDIAPPNDSQDMQETMPNIHISETPVEQPKKRKHINVLGTESQDSDDEELFQFPKKTCKDIAANTSTATEEQQQAAAKGARPIKRSMFATYNDNSETSSKIMKPSSPLRNDDGGNATTSTNRKRPHIQVLGEEDGDDGEGDDLFCFGDTQTSKKKRADGQNEDELFAFKDSNTNDQSNSETGQTEDSCDVMVSTQKFVVVEKPKAKNYSMIQMPKPKILPRKISAIDWISGSLGKIKIKNENGVAIKTEPSDVKHENGGDGQSSSGDGDDDEAKIKNEINGNDDEDAITEDHRKWLENMKNAIEIQEISLHTNMKMNERSHYRYKGGNDTTANLNGTVRNFKTFVKKYQPPSETTSIQLHIR
ncbi:uncharacterized protein [Musca autumnalis]|uniref:uncharacterized protein n=1 Tax=Musca autumnalis TaxID=221902 RepID=UPI003CF62D2F